MYNHYNKLVRDFVPNIIESSGKRPDVQVLSKEDFIAELDKMLDDKVKDYMQSKSIEDIAEIMELLDAICNARGYGIDKVLKTKVEKLKTRGGFDDRLFLIGFSDN